VSSTPYTASGVPEPVGRERRRGQLTVALAAVAWSTAGVMQRELHLDVATQLAGRALFAMLALLVFSIVANHGRVVQPFRAIGWAGFAVAVSMAVASGAFIAALNHTTVAHVLFVQAASPMMAALIALVFLGESISRRSLAAMLMALAGVGVIVGDPRGFDAVGDTLSLLMALAFAIAIVITRRRRDVSMIPAVCLAQALVVLAAGPFASTGGIGARQLGLLVAMGVVQMGLGLALFTVGARLIPAAEVALITLLEVVLGPLWVLLSIHERPDAATLAGGVIVVAAVVLQALGDSPVAEPEPIGAP
jgi:drug/metabolite transporter (DMT)-like permease